MFRKANEKFEAAKPPPAKADLAKQPFLSSSPPPMHDANIAQQFKKPRGTAASMFAPSRYANPSKPTEPLQSRSVNASPPVNTRVPQQSTRSGSGFASLYGKQDSFKDEPRVIDLTGDDSYGKKPGKAMAEVYIDENDFSDDDDLDLDFQRPSALPSLPPPAKPSKKNDEAPAPSNASVISWSQSSPSHFQPPPSFAPPLVAETTSQSTSSEKSVKRPSPEDDGLATQPVVKKRSLPQSYRKPKPVEEEKDSGLAYRATAATPATKPKAKDPHLWDATPGAVKAQKKQLKSQFKKTASFGNEASTEEPPKVVTSKTKKQSAISLSKEQEHVKKLVCENGNSVFFTGPAGTGKSVLMRAIIADMKKKHAKDPERLAVTASTGLAACNIGGMTLHSFSGIGLGKEDAPTLIKKIRRNPKAKNRWLRTKVLVVDEVSMVDGDLFDKLSQIGRVIRNNGRPWGGIQLVITGDFFQLPPVPDGDKKRDVKFAFEAATWNTSIDHTIGLTEVFRQKDPVFAQMLNEMRLGKISEQTVSSFRGLARRLEFNDGLEVTELFPTRYEVENSNQRRLRELPGKVYRYEAHDSGEPTIRDKLLANMMAPKVLELKKGAQVMLIKNLDETLVNGSLGTVVGFSTESAFEISGGGMDDGDFSGGEELDPKIKRRLAMFSRDLDKSSSSNKQEFPLVQFHAVDGSSRLMLCVAEPWKVELPTGEVQASREQLPLILAWALSIHKAQGQTLERVKVDLGKVFEKGQAYVALSRATTQQGLQVLNFNANKVMAHPRVVQFYQKLYSAETAVQRKKTQEEFISNFAKKLESGPPAARKPIAVDMDTNDEEEAMASYG